MSYLQCPQGVVTLEGPDEFDSRLLLKGFSIKDEAEAEPILETFRLVPKGPLYDLFQGERRISSEQTPALLSEIVASRIHDLVAAERPEYTFVRADVVQAPGGEGIVLAGSTFSGKTRLAQALIQAGARPWSNHYGMLNEAGRAIPYPTAQHNDVSIRVAAILNVNYQPGAKWTVRNASAGEATLNLIPLVVGNCQAVRNALPRLGASCQSATLRLIGHRGSAEEAVRSLTDSELWKGTLSASES